MEPEKVAEVLRDLRYVIKAAVIYGSERGQNQAGTMWEEILVKAVLILAKGVIGRDLDKTEIDRLFAIAD